MRRAFAVIALLSVAGLLLAHRWPAG